MKNQTRSYVLFHNLKWIFGLLFFIQMSLQDCYAQTLVTSTEAENGILSGGVTIANSTSGYSGTGYVTNFTTSADKVTVTMNVPTAGLYQLDIRYSAPYGDKTEDLYVNGQGPSSIVFLSGNLFTDMNAGKYLLTAGSNTFMIQSNWGWFNLDKFSLYTVTKHTYTIVSDLVNANATPATKALYAYLVSKFNHQIISGQTDDYYDQIKPISGKTPMLRDFEFQHYTDGYSYLWQNGGFTFGWDDSGQTQKAIDWYNQTGKTGIVSFQWHWHSPSGGQVGTNTFYIQYTTFDASKAVIPGTTENTLVLRDIDSIASQLKKLQDAGVPVLFRPLHEASGSGAIDGSGAWFWWGAKGATVCKKLFNILYNRLTNYHGLNNLIWVWSSPETAWYPGNDSIDIVGYDSYPGNYDYDPQSSSYDRLYSLTGGNKLIAMSENGPIPDPDDCFANDAPWAYFMSWSDLVTSENTNQHISDVFNNNDVITLEMTTGTSDIQTDKKGNYQIFPNPADATIHVNGSSFISFELMDLNGRVVFSTTQASQTIRLQQIPNGIYIARIIGNQSISQQKIIINHHE
jgi:mannan endo-1,4-beta-mannosidase